MWNSRLLRSRSPPTGWLIRQHRRLVLGKAASTDVLRLLLPIGCVVVGRASLWACRRLQPFLVRIQIRDGNLHEYSLGQSLMAQKHAPKSSARIEEGLRAWLATTHLDHRDQEAELLWGKLNCITSCVGYWMGPPVKYIWEADDRSKNKLRQNYGKKVTIHSSCTEFVKRF